jgi:hypothetical protein
MLALNMATVTMCTVCVNVKKTQHFVLLICGIRSYVCRINMDCFQTPLIFVQEMRRVFLEVRMEFLKHYLEEVHLTKA